ncbi:4-oxalocrotonate tautomerase [Nocardia sp. 004]|uniref:4-oxalocrotonate tautomerase n=1 Tax=Nocardia sp. 004 TaxID=3385978 RepID=UPI0039A209CE
MPLYNIATRRELSPRLRTAVAQVVLDTHCEITEAPPAFVNVVFPQGYPLRSGVELSMIGSVREGGNRDAALLARLERELRTRIAHAAGVPPAAVEVTLMGVPASWVMEGGRIMPEPGEEQDWLQH